jgi:Avirulence protein
MPPTDAVADVPADTAAVGDELDQFGQQVDAVEQTYSEQAEQKNGLQKGMDWARSWVNRDASGQGHGDDQFKNIANTRIELDDIKRDLNSGEATEQEAQQRLNELREGFASEADRVSGWQARHQQAGKFVHSAGRVATVTATGIGVTVASGNPFLGGAAAVGAGNLYDGATVALGEADKRLGNGSQDGQPSAFAPQLDTKQSFLGLWANAAAGEQITGQDVFNATTSTALDFVSGVGAGNGVKTARAAIATTTTTTTSQAVRATAGASVKNTLLQTGASYGVQATSTQVNPYLSDDDKQARQSQLARDTVTQLPGQLALSALSSGAGVAFQPTNKIADIGVQLGVDALSNTGEAAATNLIQGKGLALNDEQRINVMVGSTTGALHNIAQRPASQSRSAELQEGAETPQKALDAKTAAEPAYPSQEAAGRAQVTRVEGYSASAPVGQIFSARMEIASVQTARAIQDTIRSTGSAPSLEQIWGALSDVRSMTASGMRPESDRQALENSLGLSLGGLLNAPNQPDHPNLFRVIRGWENMPTALPFDPYNTASSATAPTFTNHINIWATTSLEGKYQTHADRLIQRFDTDPQKFLGAPLHERQFDVVPTQSGTMTTVIDGQPTKLTTYTVEPDFQRVVLIHPATPDSFRAIREADRLTSDLLSEPHTDVEAMGQLSEITWLLSHAMPNIRGSAAITNAYVRAVAKAIGMDLPPTAENVALDMEAFLRNKNEFTAAYRTFFDGAGMP